MDHSVPKTCNAVKNNFLNVFSASPRICHRPGNRRTARVCQLWSIPRSSLSHTWT